jgi:hypothetical protein
VAAALIGDEQSSHLTLHPRRDNDRTRLGQGLCSCCDVGHIAENLARRVDDNRPQVDGNARSDALPDVGSGSSASIERAPATSAVHPIFRHCRCAALSVATGNRYILHRRKAESLFADCQQKTPRPLIALRIGVWGRRPTHKGDMQVTSISHSRRKQRETISEIVIGRMKRFPSAGRQSCGEEPRL